MISSRPPLSVTHPDLSAQWHSDNDKLPSEVTAGAKYRAKWLCPKDAYVWEAPVSRRVSNGSGCPLCANRVVVAGVNDLASKFPDIAKEWHPDNHKSPEEVSPGAGYRAKWVCSDGHVWDTPVCNRTGDTLSTGCPVCAGKAVARGVNDLASQRPDLAKEWSPRNTLSADEVSTGSKKRVEWVCDAGHVWTTSVQSRTRQCTGCGKCSGRHVDKGKNDLSTLHPDVAAEWADENPKPASAYRPGSNYVAEWVCAIGHRWKTSIANRTKQGTGCPTCGNKEVLAGFNDLATVRPDLAAQWSPENTKLPTEVVEGSMYRAKWVCHKEHTWEATVSSRSKGTTCPYCTGRKVISGVTDLTTTHPGLSREWCSSNEKRPNEVYKGSCDYVSWVCSKKHRWIAQVYRRAMLGQGCPECVRNSYSSKGEKELSAFVSMIVGSDNVLTTYRGLAGVGEVDVYVPHLNIAFEFNGVYYHSEALGRDHDSHYNKYLSCRKHGVQLVAVWEDDWRDRRAVVEGMVRAKLMRRNTPSAGAKEFEVDVNVPAVEADTLFSLHHIQGACRGARFIGLRDKHDGSLVAAMALSSRKEGVEIARFASALHIAGGFARLLSVVKEHSKAHGVAKIITYSDNSVSNGDIYLRNGFTRAEDVPPTYGVVWRGSRYHKASFKERRFRTDPSLVYIEGADLGELRAANNMHRYWDYGKVRWELSV
mgnify:CR=1 FL=1